MTDTQLLDWMERHRVTPVPTAQGWHISPWPGGPVVADTLRGFGSMWMTNPYSSRELGREIKRGDFVKEIGVKVL